MLHFLKPGRKLAASHYISLITRARAPVFFTEMGIADTRNGHFDLLIVHLWPVLVRMRQAGAGALAQQLVDTVFRGFENGLREAGSGDSQTLKALKAMADGFIGRLSAYDAAADTPSLSAALARNLWPGADPADIAPACRKMAQYLESLRARLERWQPMQETLDFGPLPG